MQLQANQQTEHVELDRTLRLQSFTPLEGQLDGITQAPIHQDRIQLLSGILEQIKAEILSRSIRNGTRHRKLFILVTDGSIDLGDDSVTASDEFKRRDIVLIIIAMAKPLDR
ncbi:unnamed protein product, partial [Adineta steineri]